MTRDILAAASAVALLVAGSTGFAQTSSGVSQVPGTVESYDEATGDIIVRFRTVEPIDAAVVPLGAPVFVLIDAEGVRGVSEDPVQVGADAPREQAVGPGGADVAPEPAAGDVRVGEDTPTEQATGGSAVEGATVEPAAGDVGTGSPPTDQATGTGPATSN